MANSVGTRPMVLDTANAVPVIKGWVKISTIVFDAYAAGTDVAVLRNQDGLVVWTANGNADLTPIDFQGIGWIKGLQLESITAGVIRVFVE